MSVSRHHCHHLNPNQLIPQIQNFNCSVNTGEFWNWKAQNNFLFTHAQEPLVIIPQRYTCHLRSDESVDECDQGCSDRHFSSLWVWLFWHWRTTADLLTSKESTINLTPEELRNMMGIVNSAKGSQFYFLCTHIPPCKHRSYSRHDSRRTLYHVVCRSVAWSTFILNS